MNKDYEKLKVATEKRLESARITLKNINKKKEEKIEVSRKSLMSYCSDIILLCETMLTIIRDNKQKGIRPNIFDFNKPKKKIRADLELTKN